MHRVVLAAAILGLGGCSSSSPPRPAVSAEALLSGETLFAAPLPPPPATAEEVFGIDAEMREFVRSEIDPGWSTEAKLRRLLGAMQARGLFDLRYTSAVTHTASETFHRREGNCLSFTILFVALAREAGLRARYQMVDIPPSWSSAEDVLLVSNHINVLVRGGAGDEWVIDFNELEFRGNYERRVVDDDYALALFYTNRGAEALIAGDHQASLAALRAAIEAYPKIAGHWSNVGLIYARNERPAEAEAAYRHALAVEPTNRSVLTNLTSLYAKSGNDALAEEYRRRIRNYQLRNPYYHFARARQAYGEERFEDALDSLQTALRLKRDEHQFYFLEALVWHRLGRRAAAERSLALAREHAEYPDIKARYAGPLETLANASSEGTL